MRDSSQKVKVHTAASVMYEPPSIVVLGTVAELTRGTMTGNNDNNGMKSGPR